MTKITKAKKAAASTALLVLSLGVAAYAQAPTSAEEEALAEALGALRESTSESAAAGLPESAEAVQAREACRFIPNATARAICTGTLAVAVALDVGIPTIVGWMSEDGEEMTREQQAVLDRLADLEEWQGSTQNRLSEMDGKLDLIIDLLDR